MKMNLYMQPFFKAIVPTIAIAFLSACRSGEPVAHASQTEAIPVKLATVETSTIRDSSEFVANLESRQSVNLQPRAEGQVSRIFVQVGDRVKAGTPILQIDATHQQAAVQSSIAAASSMQAELQTAKATLRSHQAERMEKLANLKFDRQQQNRFAKLNREGAVSHHTLDQYTNRLKVAEAGLAAIEAQIEAQQAAISRAERAIQQAQANIQQESAQLKHYTITAPFDGTVGNIPVKLGDFVETITRLATVTQNDTLEVNISIPAHRSRDIKIGMPIELTDNQGQVIGMSRVFFIAPNVSHSTQSVLVKARLNNPNRQLRADEFVKARAIWGKQSGVKVPTIAISRIAGQNFVFVAQKNESGLAVRQRPVTLGAIEGNKYQVLTGLKPGEQIATTGLLQLSDGAAISTHNSKKQ